MCRIVQYYRCQRPPNQHCEERKITSRGRYGIWTSHHNVARLSTGVKAALVFEDDFTILEGRLTLKTLRDLHHNFKHHLPKTWEVFKLGQLTLGGKQIVCAPRCCHFLLLTIQRFAFALLLLSAGSMHGRHVDLSDQFLCLACIHLVTTWGLQHGQPSLFVYQRNQQV